MVFNLNLQKNANILGILPWFIWKTSEKVANCIYHLYNKFNNNLAKQYYINTEKSCHNFELCDATLETIQKILACLDSSKAAGLEGISSKFLKDSAEVIALPLNNLVNSSIKEFLFPDQCKIAKLNSIFKKGEWPEKLQVHLSVSCCVWDNRGNHSDPDTRIFR